MCLTDLLLPLLLLTASVWGAAPDSRPHIVIILADDLGWNDVSFHGSDQIPTPNIDALAYNGVILNNHYVQTLCTPTRGALLTGKYPSHLGMQHSVIIASQPYGLPLKERLMSEHLKEAGYQTRAVGKWHLGCYRSEYTPLYRGFDHHFGFMNGLQDYYNQSHDEAPFGSNFSGYDMRRDGSVDWKAQGGYSTDLFTEEAVNIIQEYESDRGPLFLYLAHSAPHAGNDYQLLQAPEADIAKFDHIANRDRAVYAAMVSRLDDSVGEVMAALKAKKMLGNSIVVFMADNGAPTVGVYANSGSNYPLRGIKASAMEGAMRGVAAVYSPLIKTRRRVSQQLMHVTDWLPTLFSAAGLDVKILQDIDGKNMWDALVKNERSPRYRMVYNLDDASRYAALRAGPWKFISGSVGDGEYDDWYGDISNAEMNASPAYDITAVLGSKANRAIRETEGGEPALQPDLVQSLRDRAVVVCGVVPPATERTRCQGHISPCLFNLNADPCERTNLAADHPDKIEYFMAQLAAYNQTAVAILNADTDPRADPMLWGNAWSPWQDDEAIIIANGTDGSFGSNGTPGFKRAPLRHALMQAALFTLSCIMLNKY